MTGKRPFRCHICGWRGWFEELELRFPTSAKKPLPPEVAGRDVPIPDFVLDEVHRPQAAGTASTDAARPANGMTSGATAPIPSGGAPQNGHSKSGNDARRGPLFAVLGMEIPEQQAPGSDPRMPESRMTDEAAIGGSEASPGNDVPPGDAVDSVSRAKPSNGTETPDPMAALKRESAGAEEMTVRPPEFDERSGLPVSSKVTSAFHHHARNKSWSCPKCGEFALYRSRARTIGESIKKKLSRKRPFRCHRCGWRGWLTR